MKAVILTTALMLGLAVAFTYGQKAEIIANWHIRRCDPSVVASAGLYKPWSDKRTVTDFMQENFQFCQGKLAKDVMEVATLPAKAIQERQKKVLNFANGQFEQLATIKSGLQGVFEKIVEQTRIRFSAVGMEFTNSLGQLKIMMDRISTMVVAASMTFITMMLTLSSFMQLSLVVMAVVLVIMIIMQVLMTIFFPAFSGILQYWINVVTVIIGMSASIAITALSALTVGAFCISPSVQVLMDDGTSKLISDLVIGDKLAEDCGTVQATMVMGVPKYGPRPAMVSIRGVAVTTTHMVVTDDGSIVPASQHPEAVPVAGERLFINLITSSRRIPAIANDGTIVKLLDWEEIDENDSVSLHAWREYVHRTLNGDVTSETPACCEEAGIHPDALIPRPRGFAVKISELQVGDKILTAYWKTTTVLGIVKMEAKDCEITIEGFSNGVWMFDTQWRETKYRLNRELHSDKPDVLYHLFTSTGDFIANGIWVRDFSDVGMGRLADTYPLVQSAIAANPIEQIIAAAEAAVNEAAIKAADAQAAAIRAERAQEAAQNASLTSDYTLDPVTNPEPLLAVQIVSNFVSTANDTVNEPLVETDASGNEPLVETDASGNETAIQE